MKLKKYNLAIKTEDAASTLIGGLCAAKISPLPKSLISFYEKLNPCISLSSSWVLFSGATITANSVEINVKVKTGIIHEIDTILWSAKSPIEPPTEDLIQALTTAGDFTELIKAITNAGLTEELKTIAAATIFAPNDDAFKKLPAGTIEGLSPEDLKKVIKR